MELHGDGKGDGGIALLSSGIATPQSYMERDLDALMRRTATAVDSGKLLPWEALSFGIGLTVGLAQIYLRRTREPVNCIARLNGVAGYLFGYTHVNKRGTSLSTMVGAFPAPCRRLFGQRAWRTLVSSPGSCCDSVLGSFPTSWRLPGCIARITAAQAFSCCRL